MGKGFIIYFAGNLIIATVALLLYRHHMKREKEEQKREREERCICDSCGHLIRKTVDDSGTAHRICDSKEFFLGDKAVEICARYERRNDIGAEGGGSGGQRPPVSIGDKAVEICARYERRNDIGAEGGGSGDQRPPVSYEEWLEKELQK